MQYEFNNPSLQVSGAGFDARNRLFFVDAEGFRFTLRLHQVGTLVDKIRSEVYWLGFLRDIAQIKTLSPVPGLDGKMIQSVSPDGLPPRYATAYDWISGKTLNVLSEEEKTPELIWNLGNIIGRMHGVSESLDIPQWFTRPRYDANWVNPQVEEALSVDYMDYSSEELAKLSSLPSRFLEFTKEQGEGRDVFGLIHLDLAQHNIVVADSQPCPIDVMHLGWGYYLLDIPKVLGNLDKHEQTIFFEGYQEIRPLPKDYQQQLALFEEIQML